MPPTDSPTPEKTSSLRLTGHEYGVLLFLLLFGMAVVYLATPSGVNTIDTLYYFKHAESSGGWAVFHSHHLIYPQAVKIWFAAWRVLGWEGRADVPLKFLGGLGALGALAVYFRLAALVLPARRHAFGAALLLGFSFLPWHFASQGEPVPWFMCFAVWTLLLQAEVIRDEGSRFRPLVGLVLVSFVGICLHQALVLTLPISFVVLCHKRGWLTAFGVVGLTALLAAGAYLAGAWIETGGDSAGLWPWLTRYLSEFRHAYGQTGTIFSFATVNGAGGAFVGGEALKSHIFSGAQIGERALVTLAYCIGLGTVLVVGWGVLLTNRGEGPAVDRSLVWLVLVSTVVFALAAIWWEPSNRKFYAPVIPGVWLLATAGWIRVPRRFGAGLWLVVLVGLIGANLLGGILVKNRRQDSHQPLVVFLKNQADPRDCIVLEENRVWQCADYYLGWPHLMSLPGPRSDLWPQREALLARAVAMGVTALNSGHRVFCSAEMPLPFAPNLAAALGVELTDLDVGTVLVHADTETPSVVQGLWQIRLRSETDAELPPDDVR